LAPLGGLPGLSAAAPGSVAFGTAAIERRPVGNVTRKKLRFFLLLRTVKPLARRLGKSEAFSGLDYVGPRRPKPLASLRAVIAFGDGVMASSISAFTSLLCVLICVVVLF